MTVRHTVYDPRRQQVLARQEAPRPGSTRPRLGILAPASSNSTDLRQPSGSLGGSDLTSIAEGSASGSTAEVRRWRHGTVGGHREAALQRSEPWQSGKVAEFAARLGDDMALKALVLHGPRGTALRAVGEAEDHKIASKMVVDLERSRLTSQACNGSLARQSAQDHQRRNAAPRSSDIALSVPPGRAMGERAAWPHGGLRKDVAFGAVYEYRDSCGTPQVVASTGKMPERQFLLDLRHHEHALAGKQEPSIVWAGVSDGAGGLNDAQMTEVRRAVADGRADRLQAKKLSDIKPYSHHG